jgi:hypothetical protein
MRNVMNGKKEYSDEDKIPENKRVAGKDLEDYMLSIGWDKDRDVEDCYIRFRKYKHPSIICYSWVWAKHLISKGWEYNRNEKD